MNRLQIGLAGLICFLLLAPAAMAQPATPRSIWHTDLTEARKEAEKLNRPLLCHFGAVWCAPCQKMERTVFNQRVVIDQLKASAVCLKIDVDQHPELAQRFGVERFPTDVFLEPNGQRLMEATGYQTPDEYRAMVDRAARRYSVLLASRQPRPAPPVTAAPDQGSGSTQLAKQAPAELMLEGYCPVTLQKSRTWKKGSPQLQAEHKSQLYQFVSTEARQEFLKTPEKYVPQFLGCDAVLIFTADRAVPGSIEWGAYYDQQLFLFTSEENRRAFKANPEKFVRTRVVLQVDQIESAIR